MPPPPLWSEPQGPAAMSLRYTLPISGEEANKALGDWLAIKSSIDACWHKLVSKFGMTICQNESKTEDSMKESKALCTCSIKEAEDNCAHSIQEAEALCSTAIREAETQGACQASSIQQSHAKDIWHLEEGAIEGGE